MKARSFSGWVGLFVAGWIIVGGDLRAFGDTIEMRNGDRYVGSVLSIDAKQVQLKNENLGTIKIVRAKISSIQLGKGVSVSSNAPAKVVTSTTGGQAVPTPAESTSAAGQAVVDQVRDQFLSAAGAEANQIFSAAAQGVLSGRTTVGDIRSQAQNAANEIRKLQRELGGEADGLDGYLAILDRFLSETRSVPATTKASQMAR